MNNTISLKASDKIRKVLLNNWDPIGVSEFDGAEDEYDQYIPAIYELILSNASEQAFFDYLWHIETDLMGLGGDVKNTKKASILCKNLEIS
jgi:hypothetical protein